MEDANNPDMLSKSLQKNECRNLHSGQCWEFYSSFFKDNYIPMLIIDPQNGNIVDANDASCSFYGYTSEEIKTLQINQIDTARPYEIRKAMQQVLSNHRKEYIFSHRMKNGEIKNVKVISGSIKLNGEELIFSIINDITDKVKTEEAMSVLQKIADTSGEVIFTTDAEGIFTYVNPEFSSLYGFMPEEVIGKVTPRILKSGFLKKEDYETAWKILKSKHVFGGSWFNKTKDGRLLNIEGTVSPILDPGGEISGFLAFQRDVTERVRIENAIKESEVIKTTLLKNMSHEFRTPVNGILGLSKMLIQESEDPEVIKAAEHINQSACRLFQTLKSILDLSYLSNPDYKGNPQEINLTRYLNEKTGEWKTRAEEKDLCFLLKISDENICVNSDEYMLNCILAGLIDNAVKYTNKGFVRIMLDSEACKDGNFAAIRIEDSGIGISGKDIKLIFNDFTQISSGYGRSYEGCGLGLTVAAKMAERLGGRIEVKSRINKGSVFSLLIPQIVNTNPEIPESDAEASAPLIKGERDKQGRKKILIVEDNYINALVTVKSLQQKYDVDSVADGTSAIEKAGQNAYELILMDINLGKGLNGIEAMKRIREIDGYILTPIIAVTGYALPEDENFLLKEGFTFYLPKPFEKFEIIKIIEKALETGL